MHAYNSHPAKKSIHDKPKTLMDLDEWVKFVERRAKEKDRGKKNSRNRPNVS